MDISANYEKKNYNYVRKFGLSQLVVECDADASGNGGVSKILSVSSDVIVSKVEALTGEAKVSGKVNYKVLFLNHDNAICSLDYYSDFTESIGSSDVSDKSIIFARAKVIDTDSSNNKDSIKLQAVVDIDLYGVDMTDKEVLVSADNALTKCEMQETSRHIAYIDKMFDINETYEANCNVDKILVFDATAVLNNVKVGEGAITVQGEASVSITYESEGKIVNKNIRMPYSEEIAEKCVNTLSRANMFVTVASSKLILAGVEDNNVMKIELTLRMEGNVFDIEKSSVVTDIFSCDCELKTERMTVKSLRDVGYRCVEERISGETTIDSDMNGIKRIIATSVAKNIMTNTVVRKGEVQVDGLINTSVIYEEEEGAYNSVLLELPYTVNIPLDCVNENDDVEVNVVVLNVASRVKRDRDIDVIAELGIEIAVLRKYENNIITGVECVGEKINTHKTISVYFVREGDTVWDAVKGIGMSEENLALQNADIDFANLKEGDRIVAFRSAN